jgi:acetoin utilization deacetylase AcuC-like enzyme
MSGAEFNGYGSKDDGQNVHSVLSCAVMGEAALIAVRNSAKNPVFAPVSGFHHSGYQTAAGYCTFNGLVMAAQAVRDIKPDALVLIVDGDGHYGDGTAEFIESRGYDWLHQCSLDKGTVGGSTRVAQHSLRKALTAKKWDLVIYQAGADSHIDDPYYSGYLTDAEWRLRDVTVFEYCKLSKTPMIWNLAGGYNGSKTLLLHTSTVSTARMIYGEPQHGHLSLGRDA